MSSISKYRKGYRAQVFIQGVRDSATFRTKREAEAWAFQREAEIRNPKPAGAHTLAEALMRYREEVSPGKRGERWEIVRISAFLKEPTLPTLRPVADLTPEDLGRWRDARLKVVTPGTVLREIALLSAVLETARREWQWLPVNPLTDMRKPKAPDHREVTISPWQAIKMLKTMGYRRGPCRSTTQAACVAFLLAMRTGMRAGELCKLKWDDVRDGFFRVTGIEKGAGKTGKRDIPMVGKALRLVETMRGFDTIYVFGLSSQTLDSLFRRYRERAGLSGFTFHDTRHTAATLLSGKLDVLTLCKMFGWRSTSQALTYYNPTHDQIRQKLERGQSLK
jgi:integrase